MHRLVPVPVRVAEPGELVRFDAALRAALDGSGPAVLPVADDGVPGGAGTGRTAAGKVAGDVADDVAVVVRTSGSGGEPRHVLLSAGALHASARATHARLCGPGRWVLALPLGHVAGVQVLVRSVVAGTEAVPLPAGSFDPVAAAGVIRSARTANLPLYTALVPTQLHRVVAGATGGSLPAALRPWRDLDAVLVGGAATPEPLLDRARELGLRVVTTYGMTETCGGCVYDGVPLDGVQVRVTDRVLLAGPVLASGYLGRPDLDAEAFEQVDGVRWLRTPDAGELVGDRLRVLGRVDEVIVTGGRKVAPIAVEAALADVTGVGQVCVVGVPDPEWGQAVTAVVVPEPGAPVPELAELRQAAAAALGGHASPRRLLLVDALPLRGPGKVDRAAVTAAAADAAS